MDSKQNEIIAHIDQTPPSKPNNVEYTYSYGSEFVLGDCSHRGLGFSDEQDENQNSIGASTEHIDPQSALVLDSLTLEENIVSKEGINCELGSHRTEELASKVPPARNSGFLSIGGLKLFTQDISDYESDDDNNDGSQDEESSQGYDSEELVKSTESDNSEEDTSDSDSDIDDEVAEDYLDGIGGSDHIIDAKWLIEPTLDESNDSSSSSSCCDGALEKFGGMALQQASLEYGMKKDQPWKKHFVDSRPLTLLKDRRTVSAGKKHAGQFPHSWPSQAQKSRASKKVHGNINSLHDYHINLKY